jgi:hypothetical protein
MLGDKSDMRILRASFGLYNSLEEVDALIERCNTSRGIQGVYTKRSQRRYHPRAGANSYNISHINSGWGNVKQKRLEEDDIVEYYATMICSL